ncbi:MAG TPA: hypothetical protein VEQ59_11150, partial [Polyangiaceae bacterium]|nr:hypothetical protein [Polyangiaceae bacterium]
CSVPLPDGADLGSLNVAMVLPPKTDGHCLPDPLTGEKDAGTCFMPLDHDPDDGFSVDKGRIVLPAAACQRKSVTGIAISQSCKTKELPIPICGPWNGWKAPASGDGGAAGAPPSLSQAGESSVAQGGASGGVGGESQGGNLGLAGETGSCPVPAELAPAYYYVLLDGSRAMQSIATIRQAIEQFTNEAASANVQFGLQVADHTCSDADFSQPVIDFTSLPLEASALPNLQPGATNELLLDSALGQSLDVLQGAGETGSKTLVVITGGVDQACGTSADLMHQTLTNALNAGVSLRPLLIRGNDAPTPAVVSGLSTAGTPTPVQLAGSSLQAAAVVSYLEQFRDTLGPCTYLAPSASKYTVQLAPADGPAQTLSAVESSAQCSLQRSTYYKQGQMLVLCPSTCASKGAAELQTDECSAVANGGTSSTAGAGGSNTAGSGASAGFGAGGAPFSRCPTTKPATGTTCTVSMTCPYTDSSCSCNEKTWSCQ